MWVKLASSVAILWVFLPTRCSSTDRSERSETTHHSLISNSILLALRFTELWGKVVPVKYPSQTVCQTSAKKEDDPTFLQNLLFWGYLRETLLQWNELDFRNQFVYHCWVQHTSEIGTYWILWDCSSSNAQSTDFIVLLRRMDEMHNVVFIEIHWSSPYSYQRNAAILASWKFQQRTELLNSTKWSARNRCHLIRRRTAQKSDR